MITREEWSGAITGSVSYTYDNNLRLTSRAVNSQAAINFVYDNDSLPIQAGTLHLDRDPQNGQITATTLGKVTEAWTYNGFAEPTGYTAAYDGATIYSVEYTRDKLGRITEKSETVEGMTDTYGYMYDQAGRLTEVTKNDLTMAIYTYDSNSNRLSYTRSDDTTITATYDDQDRLIQYGTATYGYTANGELLSKTDATDKTIYDYDVFASLLGVTLPDDTHIEYLVDGRGRRVGKKVNGGLVQGFLYHGDFRPAAEVNENTEVTTRFIYGSRSSIPDYMTKGGATYRIIADQLGSPRIVINAETGEIVQRVEYDEFGNVTLDTNPGFQPFGFAGGLYDRDTKLVRFGARDYDPQSGRWIAKDPILFDGDQLNFYASVVNDSLNHADPSGLQSASFAPPGWGLLPRSPRVNTVVCDGKGGMTIQLGGSPRGTPKPIIDCMKEHEKCHKEDIEKQAPLICLGAPKGKGPGMPNKPLRQSELRCHQMEIDCLQRALPNCNDPGIREWVEAQRKFAERQRRRWMRRR